MSPEQREEQWATGMRAAMAGDAQAYHTVLQNLGRWLRVRVHARLTLIGCRDIDAEETVQETLLAIHLKRHTWRQDEPITPWVAAIARNKLVDQLRRRQRRAEVPLDDLLDSEPEIAGVDSAHDAQDVERVLASLEQRQRDMVQLVAIEGHSAREAAARLGMTEGALRVALHRCLQGIARRLRAEQP